MVHLPYLLILRLCKFSCLRKFHPCYEKIKRRIKYIKEVGSGLLRINSVERNQMLDSGRLDILRPWWLKEAARVTFSQVMS